MSPSSQRSLFMMLAAKIFALKVLHEDLMVVFEEYFPMHKKTLQRMTSTEFF